MAREKGTGNLQQEKSGRWTLRVGINGKRYSRSTGTRDREAAERFAQRFLSPLGLGPKHLPLAEVWFEYERSPKRRDLAPTTLTSKRQVWMHFARWMEHGHLAVSELSQLTPDMVGEYLRCLRTDHCATTYNNNVCVLREICRTLYEKAGIDDDPWNGVRLLADDSHSRRELTLDELHRLLQASKKTKVEDSDDQSEWHTLFLIGIYTGLRLGDCCTLEWASVNLERKVIQVIPQKTRKHAHGHPVTIPIHPVLEAALRSHAESTSPHVLPSLAAWYRKAKWRVSDGLKRIFTAANITTSIRIEGRRYKAPEATFHSLRHTFVSLSANAGVPLTVIQSIVGHESSAMTRHYYHESEAALQSAISALPNVVPTASSQKKAAPKSIRTTDNIHSTELASPIIITERLHQLDTLFRANTITQEEYAATRARILAEL